MGVEVVYDRKSISSVFFGGVFLLILLLLIILVKPILGAMAITVVFVYTLHPAVRFILPYVKRRVLALAFVYFFILVPFFVLLIFITTEIIEQILEISSHPQVIEVIDFTGDNLGGYLVAPQMQSIGAETLTQGLTTVIEILRSVGGLFIQVLLAMFISVYVLYKEDTILGFFSSIKNDKVWELLLFIDEGLKQVVYSIFATAFLTGVIATFIYLFFGVPFTLLLGTLTAIVALIPVLGVWLVYLPISLYFFSQGETVTGLIFLGVSISLISLLPDIVIRPLIVGRKEHIDLGLLIMGFFTGTLAFGPIGVILGNCHKLSWFYSRFYP
jgi:predicted PurR-regulated permease PerM